MNPFNEKFLPWVIFLIVLVIYLGFPTKNYYWDGIGFAQTIERSSSLNPSLIHPNHLIYNVVGYLFYRSVLSIGWSVRTITVLQATNSILSALSAFVLFHILKASLRSIYFAVVLTLLFSFSATWWKFSTDANAYIPSVLLLLLSFYLVLPNRKSKPILIALTHTVSMLFHQLAIFFFPVIALGIFMQTSFLTLRNRLWRIAQYGGVAFLLTVGTFYLCFYLQTGALDVRGFANWLTSYSPETGFVFNFKVSLVSTLQGNMRLLFGGRFNFLREIINPVTILLLSLLLCACALFIVQLIRKPKAITVEKETKRLSHLKLLAILCLVWALIYLVFLFFWIPQNTFYRLFYLPSLIVLSGILIKRHEVSDARRWRAALLVLIMALSNFLFLIYPYAQVRKNTPLFLALKMNSIWSEKTVVYFYQNNSDDDLIRYFNPQTTWKKLGLIETEEYENELKQIYSDGGTVWLETSAFNQIAREERGRQWLTAHSKEQSQYYLTDPAYDLRLVQIFPRSDITNNNKVTSSDVSSLRHETPLRRMTELALRC